MRAYYIDTMPKSKLTESVSNKSLSWDQIIPVNVQECQSFRLWQANNKVQGLLRPCLGELELTYVQYMVLASLAFDMNKRAINQKQLARTLDIDLTMASQVIRKLEQNRFLVRTRGIIDGRAVSLRITAKGMNLAIRAQKAVENHEKQIRIIVVAIS